MSDQSYKSHAYHPVPTYVATVLWLGAALAFGAAKWWGWETGDLAFGLLLMTVFVTVGIGRIYTTKLQDRIIQLEMKVRCAELLAAGEDARLARLTPKQVVALRFASDEELGPLLDRAAREQLSPDDIKRAIKTWRPDPNRT